MASVAGSCGGQYLSRQQMPLQSPVAIPSAVISNSEAFKCARRHPHGGRSFRLRGELSSFLITEKIHVQASIMMRSSSTKVVHTSQAGRVAPVRSAAVSEAVAVTVESAGSNARRLYACVDISAPCSIIWGALTDYDGLGDFIPGLLHKIYKACLDSIAIGSGTC